MTKTLKEEFTEYRDAAMKESTSRLDGRFDAAIYRIREMLAKEWPEAAAIPHGDLRWQEVGCGHDSGALGLVMYRVGNEALGWRKFNLSWVEEKRDWEWSAVPASEPGLGRRPSGAGDAS